MMWIDSLLLHMRTENIITSRKYLIDINQVINDCRNYGKLDEIFDCLFTY